MRFDAMYQTIAAFDMFIARRISISYSYANSPEADTKLKESNIRCVSIWKKTLIQFGLKGGLGWKSRGVLWVCWNFWNCSFWCTLNCFSFEMVVQLNDCKKPQKMTQNRNSIEKDALSTTESVGMSIVHISTTRMRCPMCDLVLSNKNRSMWINNVLVPWPLHSFSVRN